MDVRVSSIVWCCYAVGNVIMVTRVVGMVFLIVRALLFSCWGVTS